MAETERDIDLVVWGATGFTGSLAVAYLLGDPHGQLKSFTCAGPAPADLRWAVAGRNRAKLEALGAPAVIVTAADDDLPSIEAWVRRARVVAGFAGPFVKFSDRVVEACARCGTHWVDISGEVEWHRSCIDRFGDRARATGANIVPHCGYDSIPSDLGALVAARALQSRYGTSGGMRHCTVYQMGLGGFSGGSLQTGLASLTHPVALSEGVDPDDLFLLGGVPAGGPRAHEDANEAEAYADAALGGAWVAPFAMAPINSRVVRRSNMLLGYGAALAYREVQVCRAEKQARKAARQAQSPTPQAAIKKMIEAGRLPKPGEGPTPAFRARCRFLSLVVAANERGEDVAVAIGGGECGYEETAKMCIEAALALVYDGASCNDARGGFRTPAACMGMALVHRLQCAGIRFDVLADARRRPALELARDAIAHFHGGKQAKL